MRLEFSHHRVFFQTVKKKSLANHVSFTLGGKVNIVSLMSFQQGQRHFPRRPCSKEHPFEWEQSGQSLGFRTLKVSGLQGREASVRFWLLAQVDSPRVIPQFQSRVNRGLDWGRHLVIWGRHVGNLQVHFQWKKSMLCIRACGLFLKVFHSPELLRAAGWVLCERNSTSIWCSLAEKSPCIKNCDEQGITSCPGF